jgi:spermidine synthase
MQRALLLGLFFTSGFTALVYEVLWMKDLGLLFGNTAHAAAAALAAFFLGLAAGSYVWGQRVAHLQRPIRVYAVLEAGVALSALLYFLLLDLYYALYAPLFQLLGDHDALWVAVKLVLALGILFLPAFFMGGTLPVMSQYLVQHRERLGRTTSMLYAINTCGAALGALMAGFYLPPLLGFSKSYLAAVGLTGLVAIAALGCDRITIAKNPIGQQPDPPDTRPDLSPCLSPCAIRGLAFCSGFVTLSLEVLWTRMFAQVLQNSVYTYALILVTFLLSLALGAGLAHGLMRLRVQPLNLLGGLLVAAALLVGLSPFGFNWLTQGLSYLGSQENWGAYIGRVFMSSAIIMGIPGVALGSILPFLLHLSQPYMTSAGRTVGDVVAVNTVGAIIGSLWAGFIGLEWFGLWSSIRLVAMLYLILTLLLLPSVGASTWLSRTAPVCGLLLFISFLDVSRLPRVRVQPLQRKESLYQVWEGSSATVAVVKRYNSLKLKVNNYYTVGGSGAIKFEEQEAHIPLMIHPRPRSVFFLGLGSGITAGAALTHDVERVVACELIPEVVEAARLYFKPYLHGLFEDKRATVLVEDGRTYLRGVDDRFDVIIGDLFLPWRAGVGSLYTREHFRAAWARLQPGGILAQWLPLYQMSQDEFGMIARTMLEVFPQVTLWRGDFLANRPIVALVGNRETGPFVPHVLPQADSVPFMAHYVGNLTAARHLFEVYVLNTDDRPVIEYRAPITHRRQQANAASWFVGNDLMTFMQTLLETVPPEQDAYLQKIPQREWDMVRAGFSLHRAGVLKKMGDMIAAQEELVRYQRAVAAY